MKVIAYAELTCDDCGRTLRRLAPARTSDLFEDQINAALLAMAKRHLWRVEGPSVMAGDLCKECQIQEAKLINGRPPR